jgi:hypothetical protein
MALRQQMGIRTINPRLRNFINNGLPILVAVAWLVISFAFLTFSLVTGGAAITGRIAAGHFYLGSHGNFPEVSRFIYLTSAILSTAFGLSLPIFAGVMTWRESRKPAFNRFLWVGAFIALAAGLAFCYTSFRCIVHAFSTT